MASVVHSIPGYPVLTPTKVKGSATGTTNGTVLGGIEEGDITLELRADIKEYLTGIGTDAGIDLRMERISDARIILPFRNQSATGLKILFAHLTTSGTAFRPTGGTATVPFTSLPTFAILIRPILTTEKYFYAPNCALSPASTWLLEHSETVAQLAAATLELIPCRPSTVTSGVPPWMWDSAANIATAFSLTEGP